MLCKAIKAVHRQQIDIKRAESWATESKEKELRALALTPSTNVLQLHKRVNKSESALIIQMRTGKMGLRTFLYSQKLVNNSQCEGGYRSQTVRGCKFTRLRKKM